MKNKFLESCVNDLLFNNKKVMQFEMVPCDVDLLISFPRSGNGWIRYVIAIYYSAYIDNHVQPDKIKEVTTENLKEKIGLSTISFSSSNGKNIPLDLYIPDIYQYEEVVSKISSENDQLFSPPSPHSILKTHHLINVNNEFNSSAAIVRNPYQCGPSAALLLEDGLINKSVDEVSSVVEYYFAKLVQFFEIYLEMKNKSNFFLIDLDNPSVGIGQWIAKLQGVPPESIQERVDEIISIFPHKSGFNKEVYDVVDMESLPSFEKSMSLYKKLLDK